MIFIHGELRIAREGEVRPRPVAVLNPALAADAAGKQAHISNDE